jgi:hypothetical protein
MDAGVNCTIPEEDVRQQNEKEKVTRNPLLAIPHNSSRLEKKDKSGLVFAGFESD